MPEPSAPSRVHRALHRISLATAGVLSPVYLRSVTTRGQRPRLRGVPIVQNQGRITIGDDVHLDSWPVRSHLVTGKTGFIEIGHGVSIGAGAAISSEAHVRIGDGVRLGGFVMIMDTDYHDRRDFHAPSPSLPVIIEDGARLGRNVTVLKGAHIGPGAWIGPGSVVSGTVPPGACASGVPARVFRGAAGATGGPSSFLGEGDPGLLDRVRAVVAETFHVGLPDPADGPSQIPAWDSLGTLRLLLGLEEAFGVVLPEALGDAGNVRELCDVVAAELREGDRALAYRDAER
jgi:acetyltransferase-like isoleucine patch superfamily enzyme/acyl carrier protein